MQEVPLRYNVSTLLDRNLEAGRADRVAIRCGDEVLTYGQLFDRVCRMGRALLALGVRREERVLMILNDQPAFPITFFGAIRIGAVAVPVNPLYRVEDFRYFVEDSYARVVVVEPEYVDKLRQALEGYPEPVQIVVSGPAEGGMHALEELLAAQSGELAPASTHRDDMAFWLYSSGSTGKPKGVVHLHHDIPYTCETYARNVLGIRESDTCFSTSKLFHAYGLGNNLSFPYWAGAGTVLYPGRPTPEVILQVIERYRPSLFFCVPTLYNAILNHPGASGRDLTSIRLCVSAGEALPAEVWHRWKQTFGLVILDGIGSTEMLHIYMSNTLDHLKPGSSGRPVPGYEVKVVDEEGRPVPAGEPGELYVRGDSGTPFYWHYHDKSRRSIVGEWFRSGDRYRMDADGFYWYEGRMDDMIKVGGLWVSPVEIENRLVEHPAVLESAVVGVDSGGLTRVKAFVVLRQGYAPSQALVEELQEWCKSGLQRYQYPHIVEFTGDLPKTITGKIQRFKLREAG